MIKLNSLSTTDIIWKKKFVYDNMVRISTIGDGSCFFHALLLARNKIYISQKVDRQHFVKKLRFELAELLNSPTVKNPNKTYYQTLSRGNLEELSEDNEDYKLECLQKVLKSEEYIGHIFFEFVSNILGVDIYVLHHEKQDVYLMGNDDEIFYKGRPTIVLYYVNKHYDLVGVKNKENVITCFDPKHDFICEIKKRIEVSRSKHN